MKKRLLIVLLCTAVAISVGACGDKPAKTSAVESKTEVESKPENEVKPETEIKPEAEIKPEIELTEEAKTMIPLFNAMNDIFVEISNTPNWADVSSIDYDPQDNMQYWACLARVGAMCGELYGESLVTLEGDYYKITANVMRDFAYCCFADRNQLDTVPIPDSLDNTVYYDYDWDAYFVLAGDAGTVNTIITSFIDNKDGTYIAEVDFVDTAENDKVLQHFTYELVDNEIADMSVFPYSVKSIIKE